MSCCRKKLRKTNNSVREIKMSKKKLSHIRVKKKLSHIRIKKKLSQIRVNKKIVWPEEVPVLGERDMLEGNLWNRSRSRGCLLGHCFRVFGVSSTLIMDSTLFKDFSKAVTKAGRAVVGVRKKTDEVVLWNDLECQEFAEKTHQNPNLIRARVWNLAMALLGYTEGNPEAELVQG